MIKSIALAATALTLTLSTAAQAQDSKAEVIHWWTSGGESAAVKVFADQFAKAGGTWVDSAIAGGANARTAAINRTVGGNPPVAMQFNTGKQFDDLVENDLLRDLDGIAAENNWKKIIPPVFIDAVSRNGKIYAVPVNIHGQNWLWVNNAVLEKAGAKVPTNWDDIFVTLDKVKATGLVPLALSGQKNWERSLFNYVLVGKGGPDMFKAIWGKRDAATAKSAEFKAVVETFGKLRAYVDQGSPGRNWNDATTMVIQGKAAMQFMGDWAKGEFTSAGLTPGKEYTCTLIGNGTHSGYVMGGDVFAFPKQKDPAAQKSQALLAKVLLDPETQIKFAQKKGSIPIRQDLDVSSLDACAQKAVKVVADLASQVPAQEMLAPPALSGAMEDVITQFWNNPSAKTDEFIAKIGATLAAQY